MMKLKNLLFESAPEEVDYKSAAKHFNNGGVVNIRSYKKGKSSDLDKNKVAKMFNISPKEVTFKDVVENGYNHWPDKVYILK